jgi:hypothetical protein
MVADRLRIEVFYWQPVRYNLLKIFALTSSFHSENPRVGSSILSLGTSKIKGLRLTSWPLVLFGCGLLRIVADFAWHRYLT